MKALLNCWIGRAVIAVVGLMVAGATPLLAGTVYVSTAGNDANDGQAWGTAKLTVQAGLNAAASGDQVWVAAGTYVQCITLKDGVALYGGFAGTERELSQRNWAANQSILDGSQASRGVIVAAGATSATRIDGFIIRGGKDVNGSGVYCSSYCCPTIANNTIASNSGNGIFCSPYSSPAIMNNVITGNGRGGVRFFNCSPTIAGNTITGNTTAYQGGGIYCLSSSPLIANNVISVNTAGDGGGIYCSSSSAKIANNTITGNAAVGGPGPGAGGGIYCYFPETISNNTIVANSAVYGGGIFTGGSCPFVENTIIAFNTSGIYGTDGAESLMYNCVYGNGAHNYSVFTDPTGTNGNISADPRFVSASPGADSKWGTSDDVLADLRLLPGSPCVDAGSNAYVLADRADLDGDGNTTEPLPVDLGGGPRFLDDPYTPDTGARTPPIVDMGVYEYRCGDINGDGGVDVADLLYFVDAFGSVTGDAAYDARCDFSADGAVDVIDLLALAENFGR